MESFSQLYYPSINPRLTTYIVTCLLHWDSIYRIFPKDSDSQEIPTPPIIKELEAEGILTREYVSLEEISKAYFHFERVVAHAKGNFIRKSVRIARSLICDISYSDLDGEYCIYEGKTYVNLEKEHPNLFREGKDSAGNKVFYCSKRTGLTYMGLLTRIISFRNRHYNLVTDNKNIHEILIALSNAISCDTTNKYTDQFDPKLIVDIETFICKNYMFPLFKVLRPVVSIDDDLIKKVIDFRKSENNKELRHKYLQHINILSEKLRSCKNYDELVETANKDYSELVNSLSILKAACTSHNIPVDVTFFVNESKSTWETAARCWKCVKNIIPIFNKEYLSLLVPMLKTIMQIKPAIDFYKEKVLSTPEYYPALIQESFNPSMAQSCFKRLCDLDKVSINIK